MTCQIKKKKQKPTSYWILSQSAKRNHWLVSSLGMTGKISEKEKISSGNGVLVKVAADFIHICLAVGVA